jgi:inosose dehydratase
VWYADGTPSGVPSEVFLDQASAAGYKALELGPDGYLPSDPEELKEALDSRGLFVAAGTACWAFDQFDSFDGANGFIENLDALCSRIKQFDGSYLVAMDESDVGLYSEKKSGYNPQIWNRYLNMFQALSDFTQAEYDIKTVYHPHIKSLIETTEEIERLLEYTDLDLCFDTGHHAYVNGNGQKGDPSVSAFLRKYADRIPYLHLKQVDGQIYKKVMDEHIDSDTAFDIGVMCDLPDGIIDFVDVKKTLDEIDFEGIAVVESDMAGEALHRAFDSAKRNIAYLQEGKWDK